jgi:hypothetical protein
MLLCHKQIAHTLPGIREAASKGQSISMLGLVCAEKAGKKSPAARLTKKDWNELTRADFQQNVS